LIADVPATHLASRQLAGVDPVACSANVRWRRILEDEARDRLNTHK
jgi:hypothetical protein